MWCVLRPLDVDDELRKGDFNPDFYDDRPKAKEDIPTPYGKELETSIFLDANHTDNIST